ncbi:hypothetical protein [Cupriavidus pinatubonensis]|uniref:hypothetical protein n=1 Tax=Cupriavidus pinatubonensis TaxID=248026 RepID=UPI001CC3840E|nr:hypothetical protein [Cupriavidus pinatubonensis]
MNADKRATLVKGLAGKDFSGLLSAPEKADANAIRDGALFCYNMLAYLDGDFLYKAVDYLQKGGKPDQFKSTGVRPDLMKRGAVRSVFDGRYTFARYFSPKQHNRSRTFRPSRASRCSALTCLRSPSAIWRLAGRSTTSVRAACQCPSLISCWQPTYSGSVQRCFSRLPRALRAGSTFLAAL